MGDDAVGRPLVRWTGLFALGVVIDGALGVSFISWSVLVGLSAAVLAARGLGAASGIGVPSRPGAGAAGPGAGNMAGTYGLIAALLIVGAGGWWHARQLLLLDDGLDRYVGPDPVLMTGVVAAIPEHASDRTYYVLRLTGIEASPSPETAGDGPKFQGRPLVRLTIPGAPRFDYGDVLRVRAVLQRPAPAGNPGAFDYRAYLHRQAITATAFVPFPRHATAVGRVSVNPLVKGASILRRALLQGLEAALPEGSARLAAAIALGQRRGLSPSTEENFRRAGISHLLAVSGMHVGFIGAAAMGVLRALRVPHPYGAALASVLLWAYVLVAGARPPAVRAGVAGTVSLFALQSGRSSDGVTGLAAGALALILYNPLVVHDLSFQLSFAAAGAIAAGFRPLQAALHRRGVPSAAASALALAVTAQWGVLPLVARAFYELSAAGLVAGLAAAPATALLVPSSVAASLLQWLWPWGARAPAALARLGASWLDGLSRAFADLPWVYFSVPRPPPLFIGAFWTFGFVLARGRHWAPRRRRWGFGLAALLLAATVWTSLFNGPPGLELVVIDVGQGDALFIRTSAGATALVDGGGVFQPDDSEHVPNTGTDIVIPYLRYRGVRRLDVVVNTHPHEDHLQGLLPVLERFSVRLVVDSGQFAATPLWAAYLSLVEQRGVARMEAREGDVIRLDRDTYLEVLHPQLMPLEGTRSDLNNNSVVLRLVHKDAVALLTGDIETEAQLQLLRGGANLRAGALKVPHHGSRHGLVTAFYEAVGPQVAVIPVGRNSHGHPSEEVIETLHRLGAAVYRTDVHGAIALQSDGRTWTVRTVLGGI